MLKLNHSYYLLEAGCDEAGRGCLAGPVTCAAVILSNPVTADGILNDDSNLILQKSLNDSKILSEKRREIIRPLIERECISYSVSNIFPDQIDKINILQASILGMQKAVLKLKPLPTLIIIDGNQFNTGLYLPKSKQNTFLPCRKLLESDVQDVTENCKTQILYQTIIKGDSKYQSIAAASILAKTHRDEYMNMIHDEYPMYNWKQNKGYPTKEHRMAIKKFGLTKYHRKSFKSDI